ncbi:ATP-grasp domain-containing protein [bacterium]|nr:ATP-grasp domain-containing protein [bacterium]
MQILLVGASVRALAESAARAGCTVIAADLFGDEDLRAVARDVIVIPIDRYPTDLIAVAHSFPSIPRCYTGGLENRPDVLDALARTGPLWGNPSPVCDAIRDPWKLHDYMTNRSFLTPTILRPGHVPTDQRDWLIKPCRGTGGMRVRRAEGSRAGIGEFYQSFVAGLSCSVLFAGSSAGCCRLGVTRQLLAGDDHDPTRPHEPFTYVGSVGPLDPHRERDAELDLLGELLVQEIGLRGVFGVDFIWHEGRVHVIEINPRYTASAEIIEHARQISIFEQHRRSFAGESLGPFPLHRNQYLTKRIIFSPFASRLTRPLPTLDNHSAKIWCADRPALGTRWRAGEPAFTVMQKLDSLEQASMTPTAAKDLWREHVRIEGKDSTA